MLDLDDAPKLDGLREAIGAKARQLRLARHWTQAELAGRLGLSQARLSEIERGLGSFTAEHLLQLFRLFNVGPSDFVPQQAQVPSQLQNALARLGAGHLIESEQVLPSAQLREVHDVVVEVLVAPHSPRLVTALGPVLVAQADHVNLSKLHAQLAELGLAHRLAWVVDCTVAALRKLAAKSLAPVRARSYRRAETVLGAWLEGVRGSGPRQEDVIDPSVRSREGLEELRQRRAPQARRWRLITSLAVADFQSALEQAHESG